MKKIKAILAAATIFSGALLAGSADAAVSFTFTLDGSAPSSAGYKVVQSFDSTPYTGLSGTGYIIHAASPNDPTGAAPSSNGTPYLSVQAGGTATYTFATPTNSIQFDWGTASSDNELTVNTTTGGVFTYIVPNSTSDGVNYNKNGLLTATSDAGLITSLSFKAATNAFEIDSISAAVPEPASWAMMVGGFGMLGAMSRRRKTSLSFG